MTGRCRGRSEGDAAAAEDDDTEDALDCGASDWTEMSSKGSTRGSLSHPTSGSVEGAAPLEAAMFGVMFVGFGQAVLLPCVAGEILGPSHSVPQASPILQMYAWSSRSQRAVDIPFPNVRYVPWSVQRNISCAHDG